MWRDTFRTWRARVGSVWIVVLAFLGVFAPFLANSHPLLMKMDGRWSSPLLENLTQVDVVLLVALLATIVLLFLRRFTVGQRAVMLVIVVLVAVVLVSWPVLAAEVRRLRELAALGAPEESREISGSAWGAGFLLVASLAGAVALWLALRVSTRAKVLLLLALLPLVGLLVTNRVLPPATQVYEEYRRWEREGRLQYVLRAVVPYSSSDRSRDVLDARLRPPSRGHWFGTENEGADVLSGIVHASRVALAIGIISTGIAVVIGVIVGGLMGFFAGKVDLIGMRLIEIFEAIPTLILLITFVAFFGRNLYIMMAIIGATTWTPDARFIRAEFLKLRKQDFVQAAIAAGLPLHSVLFRHMLPNGITPVLVSASFGIAWAILYESTLSFLGLGVVDAPSWGNLLEQARHGGAFIWWLAIFPGMTIFFTVFAYNLVGESLRDAIDPYINRK